MTTEATASSRPRPPQLLSFADISVDIVVRLSHLPRQDSKASATYVGEFPGGMGANVAAAFVKLGGTAALYSTVGNDERGRRSLADLVARSVDISHVVTIDDATFHTIALLDPQGEKSLVEFSTAASSPQWEQIDWPDLEGALVAYSVGSEGAHARRLFQECRRRRITTALDLECADLTDESGLHALLAETDVLLAPARDAKEVAQTASLPDAARSLLALGPSLVVITRGGRGCLVASSDQMLDVPGRSVPVVDTTGAGDCFAGAFLFGFVQGWSASDCAEVATLMAAQSVTAYGCRGRLLSLAELSALPEAAGMPILRTVRDE